MIFAGPSASFESRVHGFPTGLQGTARVRILDGSGAAVFGPVTAGIDEDPDGSGSYVVALAAPAPAAKYEVFWDQGGTIEPSETWADTLIVSTIFLGYSVQPGETFTASVHGFPESLLGTVGVRVLDNLGGTPVARRTTGIVESPAGSGFYIATLPAPSVDGRFSVFWDDGSVGPSTCAAEELVVLTVGTTTVDWVTLAEFKTAVKMAGSGRDGEITAAITAASRALNRRLRKELTPRLDDVTRDFAIHSWLRDDDGGVIVDLEPYVLRAVDAATLHPEEAAPTVLAENSDFDLWPFGASRVTGTFDELKLSSGYSSVGSTYSGRFGVSQLRVRGDWGAWNTAEVPEDIKRACHMTVGSWLDKAIAEYGERYTDEPRAMQRPFFEGYAIPRSAINLLANAGLVPFPVLR